MHSSRASCLERCQNALESSSLETGLQWISPPSELRSSRQRCTTCVGVQKIEFEWFLIHRQSWVQIMNFIDDASVETHLNVTILGQSEKKFIIYQNNIVFETISIYTSHLYIVGHGWSRKRMNSQLTRKLFSKLIQQWKNNSEQNTTWKHKNMTTYHNYTKTWPHTSNTKKIKHLRAHEKYQVNSAWVNNCEKIHSYLKSDLLSPKKYLKSDLLSPRHVEKSSIESEKYLKSDLLSPRHIWKVIYWVREIFEKWSIVSEKYLKSDLLSPRNIWKMIYWVREILKKWSIESRTNTISKNHILTWRRGYLILNKHSSKFTFTC